MTELVKDKGGRPSKNLEDMHFDGWQQLDEMILWATQAYCCEKLGINTDTITKKIKEKHGLSFSEYRHKRQEEIRVTLQRRQYEVAMSGNVTMLIWLGKQWLGQSEKTEHIVGKDSQIKIVVPKEAEKL